MAPRCAVAAAVHVALGVSLFGCGGDTTTTASPSPSTTLPPPPSPSPSPAPSPPTTTTPAPSPSPSSCLCLFDIDRTLTGKQSYTSPPCADNLLMTGIVDPAYGGGDLTLSAVSQNLAHTYCANCYIGTISAGSPSIPERAQLRTSLNVGLGVLPDVWSEQGGSTDCSNVNSPLVITCADSFKQTAIPGIVAWYATNNGVTIADENITLFDDRSSNILPFQQQSLPYNARQISCATRDPDIDGIGLCGATVAEITADKGVHLCESTAQMV